jgi:uncharacterized membrane protein
MIRQLLTDLTEQVVPLIDLLALVVILIGTVQAFVAATIAIFSHDERVRAGRAVWLRYSRWLVAGLTFQLAADIIETSVTPSWDDIGRIGAIAVIRTFLDFFLARDQHDVRELLRETSHRGEPKNAS